MCDEIINDSDSVSTNVLASVRSTVSRNFNNKKVRYKMDCDILHIVLLVIILLFIIAIIYFYYAKHKSELKNVFPC